MHLSHDQGFIHYTFYLKILWVLVVTLFGIIVQEKTIKIINKEHADSKLLICSPENCEHLLSVLLISTKCVQENHHQKK